MTELEHAHRRLAEIQAKYTAPDQQLYLRLLIQAWIYHIRVLERQAA